MNFIIAYESKYTFILVCFPTLRIIRDIFKLEVLLAGIYFKKTNAINSKLMHRSIFN